VRLFKRPTAGLLRATLNSVGQLLYYCGLAKPIIRLTPNRVRVLLYHSVTNTPDAFIQGMNVNTRPEQLEVQLDYAKKYYSVVPVDSLTEGQYGPCPLVITFDDGYKSVEVNAVPRLKERGLPATTYLIGTAVMGNMVWINQLNYAIQCHLPELKILLAEYPSLDGIKPTDLLRHIQRFFSPSDIELLMTRLENELPKQPAVDLFSRPEGIIEMQKKGMTFGFHTRDHYNLQNCNGATLDRQLNASMLSDVLNSKTFAYPFGYESEAATIRLQTYGYERLMTVNDNSICKNRLQLPRSEIHRTSAAATFAQLEIEEPIMAYLHAVKRGLHLDRLLTANKTSNPETSKPR